jgi:hypothetical protein
MYASEVSEYRGGRKERKKRGERRTRSVDISSRISITSRAARFLSVTSAGIVMSVFAPCRTCGGFSSNGDAQRYYGFDAAAPRL